MQATKVLTNRTGHAAAAALALLFLIPESPGQGTMTFRFDVLPSGSQELAGVYYESGMWFGPTGPGNVALSGGGIPGYADDGTGFLQAPDGSASFHFTNTLPSRYFELMSLDLAGHSTSAPFPGTLEVIGYKPMAGTVTNYFTLTTPLPGFQTFSLDSTFSNLFRVDIFGIMAPGVMAPFSLDNVLISGVPEPPSDALVVVGTLSAIAWSKVRRRPRLRA